MMDAIARSGSFAAAARELGKVPSALTYSVRQLEDALDVLLFDRRSRQATLTAAGQELLDEGRRLLEEMDAVANRVKRVATGWETQLTIAVDDVISRSTMLELCESLLCLLVHAADRGSRGAAAAADTRAGSPPARACGCAPRCMAGHLGGARAPARPTWRSASAPTASSPSGIDDEGARLDGLRVRRRAAPSARCRDSEPLTTPRWSAIAPSRSPIRRSG